MLSLQQRVFVNVFLAAACFLTALALQMPNRRFFVLFSVLFVACVVIARTSLLGET